jgi:hypothetical protein
MAQLLQTEDPEVTRAPESNCRSFCVSITIFQLIFSVFYGMIRDYVCR